MLNIYKHYKNGKLYSIIDTKVRIQIDDVWEPAIEYICLENGRDTTKYVRTVSEFAKKFSRYNIYDR